MYLAAKVNGVASWTNRAYTLPGFLTAYAAPGLCNCEACRHQSPVSLGAALAALRGAWEVL